MCCSMATQFSSPPGEGASIDCNPDFPTTARQLPIRIDANATSGAPAAYRSVPVRVRAKSWCLQGDVSGISVVRIPAGQGGVGGGIWPEVIQHAHPGHLRCGHIMPNPADKPSAGCIHTGA